jgi:nickel transport protein
MIPAPIELLGGFSLWITLRLTFLSSRNKLLSIVTLRDRSRVPRERRAGARTRLPLAAGLALGLPSLAAAHPLLVFASVDGEEVLVEARFASGQPVQAGAVRVTDAGGAEVLRLPIAPGTPIRFPLGDAEDGLMIEVDAGGGHENYWILTPDDIAAGRAAAAQK